MPCVKVEKRYTVPARFLDKLLGRPIPPSPELAEALAELTRLVRERPTLAGPAGVLRDVLPLVVRQEVSESPSPLSSEDAAAKLASGIPLLRGEPLPLDFKALQRRWQEICVAIEEHQKDGRARALAEAVKHQRLSLQEFCQETLGGRADLIHTRADELGLNAELSATILRFALLPVLSQMGSALAPLRSTVRWEYGYCPSCGSWPLLAELRGLEQLRYLRCGLCAADWEFPRLQCPFCGVRDHQQLGYFHVEGEEAKYRAATCDACRGYVKTISTLAAFSAPSLLVADLTTIHLDLAAAERGYAVLPVAASPPGL